MSLGGDERGEGNVLLGWIWASEWEVGKGCKCVRSSLFKNGENMDDEEKRRIRQVERIEFVSTSS